MQTIARFVSILGMAVLLSACGSSGGGTGDAVGGERSCPGPGCEPDSEPPPGDLPDPAAPLACGGPDAAPCPTGYHCVADPAAGCEAATGMACAGICVLGGELSECGGGAAAVCPEGHTCADDPRDDCAADERADCPGVCRPVAQGECADDADCPVLDAHCAPCADGSFSCPRTQCASGACTIAFKPCEGAAPCGLPGLSCEPGLRCVDDPSDPCAPERGDADCPGICQPETRPSGCGGIAGLTCPPGFACVDDPNDSCDPDTGADCPGVCEPPDGGECTADADCPLLRAPCSVCADGTEVCPRSFCDHGRCGLAYPGCPPPPGCGGDADCGPGEMCLPTPDPFCDPATGMPGCLGICVPDTDRRPCSAGGEECPDGYRCEGARDDCEPDAAGNVCPGVCLPEPPPPCRSADDCAAVQGCRPCPDGTLSCPTAECRDGVCMLDATPCPAPEACRSDADCAVIEACIMCRDGAVSCPHAECRDGNCVAAYPPCPSDELCGGIAGIPCPPGYACVDRPGDDCDPRQGGADCGGVCQREDAPRPCAGFLGTDCPPGYECVDAADDCDPANGGADCPGFCRPAPLPPCASDADCPIIGAPCQVCADGTAACPRSFCANRQCNAEFPTCDRDAP